MRTVIFDLDGTLADTSADLIAAANACFRGMGVGDVLSPERDAVTAGQGARAMLRLGLGRLGQNDEALVDAQYPLLLAAYEARIDDETVLYPGAADAVATLFEAGVRTGICTNKPERLALILLERLGVRDLFGSVVGADTFPVRKPDPVPYVAAVTRAGGTVARSMLVGDTDTDHKTALAAGVPSVLVTFGPEGAGIARLQPHALLDRFADLPALTDRVLGSN